jgi:hypothetical protein
MYGVISWGSSGLPAETTSARRRTPAVWVHGDGDREDQDLVQAALRAE